MKKKLYRLVGPVDTILEVLNAFGFLGVESFVCAYEGGVVIKAPEYLICQIAAVSKSLAVPITVVSRE